MQSNYKQGQRVRIAGYSYGDATFIEYGDPRLSCPEKHITSPGMRIAYVEFDRYGRQPVWEDKVSSLKVAR